MFNRYLQIGAIHCQPSIMMTNTKLLAKECFDNRFSFMLQFSQLHILITYRERWRDWPCETQQPVKKNIFFFARC